MTLPPAGESSPKGSGGATDETRRGPVRQLPGDAPVQAVEQLALSLPQLLLTREGTFRGRTQHRAQPGQRQTRRLGRHEAGESEDHGARGLELGDEAGVRVRMALVEPVLRTSR